MSQSCFLFDETAFCVQCSFSSKYLLLTFHLIYIQSFSSRKGAIASLSQMDKDQSVQNLFKRIFKLPSYR